MKTEAAVSIAIRYINLDESTSRRASIKRQLKTQRLDRQAERFSAIRPDIGERGLTRGEWGCLQSHRNVMESTVGNDVLLVLEDDAILSARFADALAIVDGLSLRNDWDVIFLSFLPDFLSIRTMAAMCRGVRMTAKAGRTFDVYDATGIYGWGGHAYAVHPRARERIVRWIDVQSATEQALPIDTLLHHLVRQKIIKALAMLPFAAMIDISQPSISVALGRTRNLDEDYFPVVAALFMPDEDHLSGLTGVGSAYCATDPDFREACLAQAIGKRMIANKLAASAHGS